MSERSGPTPAAPVPGRVLRRAAGRLAARHRCPTTVRARRRPVADGCRPRRVRRIRDDVDARVRSLSSS